MSAKSERRAEQSYDSPLIKVALGKSDTIDVAVMKFINPAAEVLV